MSVYLGKNKVDVNVKTTKRSVPSKDVDFYDYDGTRVYSYTAAEFAALTEMPANPDHSHDAVPLTAQGWNWSMTDAKAYVASYGGLVIGQTYIPTDGKTHIIISIPSDAPAVRRNFILHFGQTISRGVTVDWGDGTSETFSGTTTTTHEHLYTNTGDYDISLEVTSGKLLFTGASGSAVYGIYGAQDIINSYRRDMILGVHIGNGVTEIGPDSLCQCDGFQYITIPIGVDTIGYEAFSTCYALRCAVLPHGLTTIDGYAFNADNSILAISLPNTVTQIAQYAFTSDRHLRKMTLPESVTAIPDRAFNENRNVVFIPITNTVTSIGSYAFNYCFGLLNVTVPSSVTSIGNGTFIRCCASEYHFKRTTPPTLSANSIFNNTPSDIVIYVPRGSLNAYKTATNWSSYASKMQEEPE